MGSKNCTRCNIEKSIQDFYNENTECKIYNNNRRLKCFYVTKDRKSNEK